jgi:uncharacterized phage protein gp47/JayE
VFEAYTYEQLLEDVLDNAPPGVDTRQGSIFYDAVSGILVKIAKYYTDLDLVFELTALSTATGEYLDLKAEEHGKTRLPATNCRYCVTFEGTQPDMGERFFAKGFYFTLLRNEEGENHLKAEEAGTAANKILPGTPAVPMNNIDGLTAATFGKIMELGMNEESDKDLRNRVREKIAGPSENGNRQHYKTWCEEVDGVGRARIVPLWEGPNTVKGIIINLLGLPADATVLERVQEYIDPDNDGDGRGDGLGEGTANLGAHFTAIAPAPLEISVAFSAVLASGSTVEQAEEQTTEAVTAYLKALALDTPESRNVVVRISSIGATISSLPAILDYSDLTLNGSTANIEPGNDAIAVLEGVTVNVLQ